ncbi:hypothetical protein [Micromonospora sp. NBS 11-29]|uniref:hypothetical protein n=1 Tax=Micromonospora sp. NBS 11-29 TaxID=1960879 RepID=UPI001124B002|nr:hypothetical protein [Micromonospora sp. NBS 11-29]
MKRFVEFEQRMEDEYGVNLRFTFFPVRGSDTERFAIRLAPHLYNNREEIDHAVDSMIKLTEAMA